MTDPPPPAPPPSAMWVDYIPLDDLDAMRWSDNPKEHDLGALVVAIQRHGFVSPLLLDEGTQMMVAGHGRHEALRWLYAHHSPEKAVPARIQVLDDGRWAAPVVRGITFANASEAQAYVLTDNRLVEVGGWDEARVADILEQQMAAHGNGWLEGTGFDELDIEYFLSAATHADAWDTGVRYPEDDDRWANEGAADDDEASVTLSGKGIPVRFIVYTLEARTALTHLLRAEAEERGWVIEFP